MAKTFSDPFECSSFVNAMVAVLALASKLWEFSDLHELHELARSLGSSFLSITTRKSSLDLPLLLTFRHVQLHARRSTRTRGFDTGRIA